MIELPSAVRFIIERMKEHGKRADIVGGCVRDSLLGRTPDDYDITTDATPEETKNIFSDKRIIETGLAHGTVTLVLDGKPYEITTYRIESGYSDNRHPDSVEFTGNLRDDLSRRDFTVNAMCYNEEYGLTDAFGGLDDLSGRLIRAVGDPELRFSEDALRILRAIRFSSVLGFEIEEKTAEAAVKKRELLRGVSVERIFTELKKLLMGKGAASVIEKYESILTVFLPELKGISVRMKDHPHLFSGMDATSAFVTLFAIDQEITEKGYRLAAERLKTDNYVRNTGAEIVKYLRVAVTETDTDLLKLLSVTGYDVADRILEIRLALGIDKEDKRKVLERIEKTRPYKISHLNINGNDLMEQGIRGSRIGDALSRLLNAVINGEVSNTKEELKRFVNKLYR